MICTKCRFITDDDSAFCPRCGEKMASSAEGSEAVARLFKSFNKTVPENGIKLGADVSSSQSKTVDTGSRSDHTGIAGLPPISTNAYVKDPNKIKHNSESEKRIAVSNTLDKLKVLTDNLLSSLNSDFNSVDKGLTRAENQKLSGNLRKELKKTHDALKKTIATSVDTEKTLEQMLGSFGGESKLLLDNVDSIWKEYDKLYQDLDNAINEIIPLFKMGPLGSSECQYRKQQFDVLHSKIITAINSISMAENKLARCMMSYDFDTKVYMKAFNKVSVPGYKKDSSGTRSSQGNKHCLFFTVISWLLFIYLVTTVKRDTGYFLHYALGAMLGGIPLGIFHMYHVNWIRHAIYSILERLIFIIIPPLFVFICLPSIIVVMIGFTGSWLLGWLYMLIDPIRILLGFQCVKDDD